MKTIYLILSMLVGVCSMSLTACGNDDDELSGSGTDSDYIGTWSVQYAEGWGLFDPDDFYEDGFSYLQFKSDGSFINVYYDEDEDKGYVVDYCKWSVSNDRLIIQLTTGDLKGTTMVFDIIHKEKNKMTITRLGFTTYLVKVSDSIIEKYLN